MNPEFFTGCDALIPQQYQPELHFSSLITEHDAELDAIIGELV